MFLLMFQICLISFLLSVKINTVSRCCILLYEYVLLCFVFKVKRDCEVSPWSDWGPCSPRCGVGVSQRTRTVLFLPVNGGKECPPLIENKGCLRHLCGGRELGKSQQAIFFLSLSFSGTLGGRDMLSTEMQREENSFRLFLN